MSDTKDNGGPAFPADAYTICHENGTFEYARRPSDGMSLRDWFAGLVLAGMVTREQGINPKAVEKWGGVEQAYAMQSYVMADAMIKARAQ